MLKIALWENLRRGFGFIFVSVSNCVNKPSFIYISQFRTEILNILFQRSGTELPHAKNSSWGDFEI